MTELEIHPLAVPRSLDAPDAGPFREVVRIFNAMCRDDAGHHDLDEDETEMLGSWRAVDDAVHLGYVAAIDGETVGAASLAFATQAGTTAADYDLILEPRRWGAGIEDALYERVEREARRRGFEVLQTWTLHRPDPRGDRLVPSTGWGSIPAGDRQTRFPLRQGYSLEQVERTSSFDLGGPYDGVETMLRLAEDFAGDDYRTVWWSGGTPDDRLDAFAHIHSRMSTDAPQGGMRIEEEHWDADRVRRRDARQREQGLFAAVVAVEHVPSGGLAAYNELVIGADRRGVTHQYGTLVLPEHRGRRLGTIVKCAGLLRWRELAPDSPRVSTFNAEENRHMLSINEAIGFVPVSYAGAWKKALA